MSALCRAGRLAKLEVSTDDITYVNVGGIVDISMNVDIDSLECTDHDTTGSREFIRNLSNVTMDADAHFLDGDAGQEILLQNAFVSSSDSFFFKFTMETNSGNKIWTGKAFPTSASPSGPLDDTGALSISLQCSNVVMATQP